MAPEHVVQSDDGQRGISMNDFGFSAQEDGIGKIGLEFEGLGQRVIGLIGLIIGQVGLGQGVKDRRLIRIHRGGVIRS